MVQSAVKARNDASSQAKILCVTKLTSENANVRDVLKLAEVGIETGIHYPIPIHLQPASINLGYKKGDFKITEIQASRILTLPINQYLNNEDIEYVSQTINRLA